MCIVRKKQDIVGSDLSWTGSHWVTLQNLPHLWTVNHTICEPFWPWPFHDPNCGLGWGYEPVLRVQTWTLATLLPTWHYDQNKNSAFALWIFLFLDVHLKEKCIKMISNWVTCILSKVSNPTCRNGILSLCWCRLSQHFPKIWLLLKWTSEPKDCKCISWMWRL